MEPEEFKASQSYREWWEANKERILEEDRIRRELDFKHAVAKSPDEFLDQFSDEE